MKRCLIFSFALLSACSFFRDVEPRPTVDAGPTSVDSARGDSDGEFVMSGGTIDIAGDVLEGDAEPDTTLRWTFGLSKPQVISVTCVEGEGRADIYAPVEGLPKADIVNLSEGATYRFFLPAPGEYSFEYQAGGGPYELEIEFSNFAPVVGIDFNSPYMNFASGTSGGMSEHDITIPVGESFLVKLAWLEEGGVDPETRTTPDPSIVALDPATGDYWVSTESAEDELVHDLFVPATESNRYLWLAIRMNGGWRLTWQ